MKKIKSYKSVREFSSKGMGLSEYEAWLIAFKNSLIKLIITTRKHNGLTQGDLAEILGTTQSVISRLECGSTRNITIDYLLRVVSGLGISPKKMIKIAA